MEPIKVKNLVYALFITCISSGLSGCFQLRAPICQTDQLSDIPGFAGKYDFRWYNPETYETVHQNIEIARTALGTYSLAHPRVDASSSQACVVNGKYILQSLDKNGNYQVTWVRSHSEAEGFSLTSLAANVSDLDHAGIPHTTIPVDHDMRRLESLLFPSLVRNPDEPQEPQVLLIDNSKVSAPEFLKLMNSMSLDLVLWRMQ